MKIKRLSENLEPMLDSEFIDPMEICPKCGSKAMHMIDHSPLDIPGNFIDNWEAGLNFDDEMYAEVMCENCKFKENITGKIKWSEPSEFDKRKEYIEQYKKGIDPRSIKKYNL